jgi:hypothetical protein
MSGYNLPGTGFFMAFMALSVVIGWAIIEFVLWVFSFITVTVG